MIVRRTIEVLWHVEIGTCDGGGIGRWTDTTESVPFEYEADAQELRSKWLSEGKLEITRWGETRPKNLSYSLFRIRRGEKLLDEEKIYQ